MSGVRGYAVRLLEALPTRRPVAEGLAAALTATDPQAALWGLLRGAGPARLLYYLQVASETLFPTYFSYVFAAAGPACSRLGQVGLAHMQKHDCAASQGHFGVCRSGTISGGQPQ